MTVVTEKDKWNKIISHGDMLEFQAGPIGKLFQYLRLELGSKVKVFWVEKLPPKYPDDGMPPIIERERTLPDGDVLVLNWWDRNRAAKLLWKWRMIRYSYARKYIEQRVKKFGEYEDGFFEARIVSIDLMNKIERVRTRYLWDQYWDLKMSATKSYAVREKRKIDNGIL